MLTGRYRSTEDLIEGDGRKDFPRYQPGAFEKNMELVKAVEGIADKKGCTVAQLSFAWIESMSGRNGNPVLIPLPSSTSEQRIRENLQLVTLTPAEFAELDEIVRNFDVTGDRYPGKQNDLLDG
jgi:pyridoxine 4-dehydrogenase